MNIKRPEPVHKLPADAEKVFSGVIFDVYQWDQKQFDGSLARFEVLKRPDTVSVIPVTENKKIIVTEQSQPSKPDFRGMLGGRVDGVESPLEAAKRELLEESGMKAEEWIFWDARRLLTKIDWVIFTFVARGLKKVAEQNLDSGEKIKLIELNWDEFIDFVTDEEFLDIELSVKFLRAKLNKDLMEKYKKQILG